MRGVMCFHGYSTTTYAIASVQNRPGVFRSPPGRTICQAQKILIVKPVWILKRHRHFKLFVRCQDLPYIHGQPERRSICPPLRRLFPRPYPAPVQRERSGGPLSSGQHVIDLTGSCLCFRWTIINLALPCARVASHCQRLWLISSRVPQLRKHCP